MNQEVAIGKSAYGRSGGNHGWFRIEDNKDNIYRVLPPMKSMAPTGKYAKFYATHRGFRGTDNKQKPFLCIEESDYKTKIIRVHCPVCDWVKAIEKEVDGFKAKGASDDQIREYRNKYIFPFQAERKYYLNVVNMEGKIGVLAIGSRMFKSLEALAMEQEKAGRDVTGMEGLYVNFKKQTAFKGDKNAIHTAVLYMHPDGTGGYRPVTHTIDQTFAQRLGAEAADLGSMFKSLEIEQIAKLVSLDGDARSQYVDTLFEKEVITPVATQAPVSAPTQAPPAAAPVMQQGFASQTLPPPPSLGGHSQSPAQQGAPLAPPVSFAQNLSVSSPLPPPPSLGNGFGGQTAAQAASPAVPNMPAFGAGVNPGQPTAQLSDAEFASMVRPPAAGK